MVDLDNLDLDIDITVSRPEDYADNTPAPLAIGSYTFRLLDWDIDTRGKTPCIVLKQVEVTEGPSTGRKVGFQRIYPTVFTRKNAEGEDVKVSQLGDFLRSLDRSFTFSSIHDVKDFLNKCIDAKTPFKAKLDWEGFDSDYWNQEAPLRGIQKGDYKSAESKALSKLCTIRGKAFNGKAAIKNPNSGNTVEAKMKLAAFYPARD